MKKQKSCSIIVPMVVYYSREVIFLNAKETGMRIKQQRKLKGLTQEELAIKSNLSVMSIRRYESGERIAPEPVLQRIADAIGIPVSDLDGKNMEKKVLEYIQEAHKLVLGAKDEENPTKKREMQMDALKAYVKAQEMAKISNSVNEKERQKRKEKLLETFEKLNDLGQEKAIGYAEGLAEDDSFCVKYLELPGVFDELTDDE